MKIELEKMMINQVVCDLEDDLYYLKYLDSYAI